MQDNYIQIAAISDTHGLHEELDQQILSNCDIIIHAGDFTMSSNEQEYQSFKQFLQNCQTKEKIVIPGNHEIWFDPDAPQYRKQFKQFASNIQEQYAKICRFVEFQLIAIKGINILCISKRIDFFDWNFDFFPQGGEAIIQTYKGKVDILVTHYPPFGVLDQTRRKNEHGGSIGLLKFVNKIKPKIHIFGHIHEARGFVEKEETKFYNVCNTNEKYEWICDPTIIKFNKIINE